MHQAFPSHSNKAVKCWSESCHPQLPRPRAGNPLQIRQNGFPLEQIDYVVLTSQSFGRI